MKNTLFPFLIACALLADAAPAGCGKRNDRPIPQMEPTPPADTTPVPGANPIQPPASPAPTDAIPAPPEF